MLDRMGGGISGESRPPSNHHTELSGDTAVKLEGPQEVWGINEDEEEEEFIDEGDPVIVPWGSTPPPASPEEPVEEEEGNYSEDELYAEPGKPVRRSI